MLEIYIMKLCEAKVFKKPNWCDCELIVRAKNKSAMFDIDTFMAVAHSEIHKDLDFNNFIPYPKKYKDVDDKAKQWRETNKCKIPPFKDGYNSGGYDWCIKNWGTKWNATAVRIGEYNIKTRTAVVIYDFQTAWSPPNPVVYKMSKMFPSLCFELKFFEGGVGYKGVFKCENGEIVKDITNHYMGGRGG